MLQILSQIVRMSNILKVTVAEFGWCIPKNFAELGKGNVIFLDGSSEGMEKTMRQIMAMQEMKK